MSIFGLTTWGRKVAKRFTPELVEIMKGCATRFFARSEVLCICSNVVETVPTKCPMYRSHANSRTVVGTMVPSTIKKEKHQTSNLPNFRVKLQLLEVNSL